MTAIKFHKEYSKTTRLYQGGAVCTFDEMIDFAEAYYIHRKKTPAKPQQFYAEQIAENTGAQYLAQYHEFINLLFDNSIPAAGILKIEGQLSYVDFVKVLLKASGKGKLLSDLVSSMANSNKYTQGKKSLYLTLNSWLNRD